jgi:hypothetical protein
MNRPGESSVPHSYVSQLVGDVVGQIIVGYRRPCGQFGRGKVCALIFKHHTVALLDVLGWHINIIPEVRPEIVEWSHELASQNLHEH